MGTIYEIICWTTGRRYVGKTIQSLQRRLIEHESKFKCKNGNYYSAFLVLKHGNYNIYELEKVEDESKLNEREKYYIQHTDCINYQDGSFNEKEYYEANKEDILQHAKEYHKANRENILEKMKEYREANKENNSKKRKEKYTCDCGSILRKSDKARHEKSKKHLNFLNNSTNKDEKESIDNETKLIWDTPNKI